MIIGSKFKLCRRLGTGVFGKCQSQKYLVSEARHAKSSKGKRPKTLSNYGAQLLEKQKIRFTYGITEKQLQNYVAKATAKRGVNAAEYLRELLERRLDNVVYRLGFASSRRFARQLVSHGHFVANGHKTTVPSFSSKEGDVITVREGSRSNAVFKESAEKMEKFQQPNWLSYDAKTWTAKMLGVPKDGEEFLDFGTVLEFYSR